MSLEECIGSGQNMDIGKTSRGIWKMPLIRLGIH
jgi:hypothetical protein